MASDKMLGSFDQKSAPEDNDLLVEYDASASKVKNVKFGGVWNWIVKKLTSAVINELQTSSKNVVGAINELNSKTITYKDIDIDISTLTMQQNFGGYYTNIPVIDYLKADKLIYSIFIIKWERISTYTAVCLDTSATKITIYQATNSKQGILKIRIVYKK